MMKMNFKIFGCFLVFFLILSPIIFVYGQGLVPCGGTGQQPCQLCDLLVLARNIISFLQQAGVALSTLFVAYGGFYLLTSGESEERRSKGKEILKSAIIGLVIVLAGWLIVNTILTFVASASSGTSFFRNWSQINCHSQSQ